MNFKTTQKSVPPAVASPKTPPQSRTPTRLPSRSSHSHHSSVKIQCTPSPEFDKLIFQRYGLPTNLNSSHYELYYIHIEKPYGSILGVQMTDTCMVHQINVEDVDVIFGDLWLEFNGILLEDKKHFTELFRKMKKETNGMIKFKIKIARLLWKQKLPDKRMPVDILPKREYLYHLAVIYGIPEMHLTLGLKAINGKVFVSSLSEETLGRMAFAVGDSILEVDHNMVSNINVVYDLIKQNMKLNGIVTCVVERADSANASYFVREAIRSDKNPHKEERLNKDVEKICRKEKRKLQHEPNIQAAKSILKNATNSQRTKTWRVKLKNTHSVTNINADINPKLLQPVPSHNILPSDATLAPGRSAESILSELSSEATTEEGEKPRLTKTSPRPMRQKDCRLTTGTKIIKQKKTEESKPPPMPPQPAVEKKPAAKNESPKETKESDSGRMSLVAARTQTTHDSAKRPITAKTQQTTDSRKKTFTVSKTPDTDSRKRSTTTTTTTTKSRTTTNKTSPKNSLKGNNSNSQR